MSDAVEARPHAVVIEDDPDTARLLSVILRQCGFGPVVATDGPAGVEAVRAHRPVITTVDVGLPGPDGRSVIRRIREFSSTYVVVVSGLASEDDLVDGLDAGADDYVTKPFRLGELRSRLLAGLRRPASRLPAPAAPPPRASGWAPSVGEVEFEGDWVRYRGLRLNPGQGVLTVGAAPVPLDQLEIELLDLMLRSGARTRTTRELAESLRGQHELVVRAMGSLLGSLGEDAERPLWIESADRDGYRLAPIAAQRAS